MADSPLLQPGERVLLGTTSQGKQRELRELFADLPLVLVTPSDLGIDEVPAETGTTFAENALAKARHYHAVSRLPTLAEDSGLEVDALDGAPGVFSARWEGLPDGAEKNARLLERLVATPDGERGCRYVCHMVFVDHRGEEYQARGELPGQIAQTARGEGGFGYDPVVYLPDVGKTVAELAAAEKNRRSHRGAAAAQLRRALLGLLAGS
jgi:XTP/dITP diphosphohydrolase